MSIYKTIQSKSRSKLYIAIIAFIIFLFVCCFIYFKYSKIDIHYVTTNPIIQDITQEVSATGVLSPINTIEVGSQISGTILEILVDTNDEVKKGQVLAKIDPEKLNQSVDNYEAQLKSAKARLYSTEVLAENKKWTYDNYLELFNKTDGKSPSRMQLKTSELEYKSAIADIEVQKATIAQLETSLNSAKIDVKNSIITSPVNGVVLSRKIEVGQTVTASFETPKLFTIAQDLTKMKLISNVLEADVGKVKVGQDVEFSVDAYPNEIFKSKVKKVNFADQSSTSASSSNSSSSNSSSSNIVSYEVTTYISNDKLLLRPGMSATANIKTAGVKNALTIPYQALSFNPDTYSSKKQSNISLGAKRRKKRVYKGVDSNIWILDNGELKEIAINIGISDGSIVEVIGDDINKDTKVVLQIEEGRNS